MTTLHLVKDCTFHSGFGSQRCGPGKGAFSAPHRVLLSPKEQRVRRRIQEGRCSLSSARSTTRRWKRTGSAPPPPQTLAATRDSRSGSEASLRGAIRGLLSSPSQTPKTPNTCVPGKNLCARSLSRAARPRAKPVKPITAPQGPPVPAPHFIHPGRRGRPRTPRPAPPRGSRRTSRPREYLRRPRAARGHR